MSDHLRRVVRATVNGAAAATVEDRGQDTVVRATHNGRSFRTLVGNVDMHIAMAAAHLVAAGIQLDQQEDGSASDYRGSA